jgi:hypothetical protein
MCFGGGGGGGGGYMCVILVYYITTLSLPLVFHMRRRVYVGILVYVRVYVGILVMRRRIHVCHTCLLHHHFTTHHVISTTSIYCITILSLPLVFYYALT